MFDVQSITHNQYTTVINANSGETQLVVSFSAGQCRKYVVCVYSVSADMGMDVIVSPGTIWSAAEFERKMSDCIYSATQQRVRYASGAFYVL